MTCGIFFDLRMPNVDVSACAGANTDLESDNEARFIDRLIIEHNKYLFR